MAKPSRKLPRPPEVPPTSLSEWSAISPRISPRQDAACFVHDEELAGGHVGKLLPDAAGPLHFQRHGGRLTQPERQRQVAGGTVAGAGAHHIPLLPRPALYAHHGADRSEERRVGKERRSRRPP